MATNTRKATTLKPGQKPVPTNDAQAKSLNADGDERKRLCDDLTTAIKAAFTKQGPDPQTRFHEQFRKEADEYDKDFHVKYHDDFNTTLIFAGLFSAVASAFIVDLQSQIRPDYNQMSFTVLTMLLNATSGASNQPPLPTWTGPDPSTVQVQAVLFSSLASSLLAALLAMLGKQWLNFHVEGSFIDRNRHRELKMRGMITWHFKFIMECVPLIMQASLLLLGYALGRYLWDISRTVSSVIAGFTAFGTIFYIFIVVAGTISKTCPFQTPISVAIRATWGHYREDITEASKAIRRFFGFTRSQARLILYRNQISTRPIASDIDDQDDEIRSELRCISTMFRMTKAPDSVTAIMGYIPEITWDDRVKSVPLLQVYQTLRDSLWRSADGKISPRQGARDRAFWSAKALLHLYVQRRCICPTDTTLSNQVGFIDHPKQPLGYHGHDSDPELASTFYIVDWTFGAKPRIPFPWSGVQLKEPHHRWLSHILQYRARDILRTEGKLSDDVKEFVIESLSRGSPTQVVADCLFIANMVAGHIPQPRDLLIKDRSHQITEIIDDTFDRLDLFFSQNTLPDDISSAVEALRLVVPLRDRRICARSYTLFRTIMNRVSHNNLLWLPARLSMEGAYSPTKDEVPRVGDPTHLLQFLRHHMSPEQWDNVGYLPVHHVFSAIALASTEETHRGLAAHNDFPNPLFIDTTIKALENKDFKHFRKSAIFMLAELDNHLFTTENAFTDPVKASRFVRAWSSAIHEFLGDPTYLVEKVVIKVLLAIAHLPCLREHLPKERWNLIQHFPHIMNANPPALQRCLKDTTIFPFLKRITDGRSPSPWLGMLWMMHHRLSDEVRKQLESETREIVSQQGSFHLEPYVSLFDAYLKNLQVQISELDHLDQAASNLRVKRELMTKAKERLVSLKKRGERASLF